MGRTKQSSNVGLEKYILAGISNGSFPLACGWELVLKRELPLYKETLIKCIIKVIWLYIWAMVIQFSKHSRFYNEAPNNEALRQLKRTSSLCSLGSEVLTWQRRHGAHLQRSSKWCVRGWKRTPSKATKKRSWLQSPQLILRLAGNQEGWIAGKKGGRLRLLAAKSDVLQLQDIQSEKTIRSGL